MMLGVKTRYDPTIELKTDISTESHRVAFLQSATRLMVFHTRFAHLQCWCLLALYVVNTWEGLK
jgi:hypothetical protein